MRVTIDAVPLLVRSAGVKNYLYYWIQSLLQDSGDTGVKNYLYYWIQSLLQDSGDIDVRLFPFLNHPSRLDHEGSAVDVFTSTLRLGLVFLLNRFPNSAAGWMTPKTDVFHTCKLLNPPRRAKLTATVHDLTCWLLPDTHLPSNVAADKLFADRILRRADALIAVSEATRQDAVRMLNLPPERIRVIHHGVAEAFFSATPEEAEAVRLRRRLERPYVLFVGTIEPRKNVGLLLDAFQKLPHAIRQEFELVVAGPSGWGQNDTLARLRQPSPGIRYLGYVDERDLPGLFAGAAAFVYPSLYEGFGFPVAQAMAAGTPVITSNVSALPEIAGDAAMLIDPRSVEELSAAIQRLLTSPSRRCELITRGRSNAARFSWTECARRSLQFFSELTG